MVSLACIFDAHEVCGLDGCGCRCHKGETFMSLPEDVEEELEGSEAQRLEPSDLYDPCVIGLGYRFHDGPLLVYSMPKVIALQKGAEMSDEEAEEYFNFNTLGAWMGEGTPLFVHLFGE